MKDAVVFPPGKYNNMGKVSGVIMVLGGRSGTPECHVSSLGLLSAGHVIMDREQEIKSAEASNLQAGDKKYTGIQACY